MKYLTNLDLNKNELQNVRIQNLATAPENPVEGQIYYNTVDKVIYQWSGTAWKTVGGDLPVASSTVLGGVKVGNGLSAEADGTLSTDIQKIKVNGTELTPDANKAVNVECWQGSILGDGTSTFTDVNDNNMQLSPTQNGLEYVEAGSSAGSIIELASVDYVDANSGKIDKIKRNGVEQTITNKTVDLNVPDYDIGDSQSLVVIYGQQQSSAGWTPYDLLRIVPNASGYEVSSDGLPTKSIVDKTYVDNVATGALKPSGSVTFANLPALSASVLNNLYNVSDAFTTTADFVEGTGKEYPAGTNVAIINVGTEQSPTYKYDAMTGIIDVSGFATKTDVNGLITTSTGTIGTSDTTATVNYTGTLLEAYATQNGERVMVDISQTATAITFTCASAPSAAITCTVVAAGTLS